MRNDKKDLRSRYTREIIMKSMLCLLAEKPLKSVTVAELCKHAQVTRGTFYNHFYDVYDVYESIENKFFEEIVRRLEARTTFELDIEFFREILRFLSENSDAMKTLLSDGEESSILKKIIRAVRDKYVTELSERFPESDRHFLDSLYTYSVNGSLALLVEWLRNDERESPEQMATLIEVFNRVVMTDALKRPPAVR